MKRPTDIAAQNLFLVLNNFYALCAELRRIVCTYGETVQPQVKYYCYGARNVAVGVAFLEIGPYQSRTGYSESN